MEVRGVGGCVWGGGGLKGVGMVMEVGLVKRKGVFRS